MPRLLKSSVKSVDKSSSVAERSSEGVAVRALTRVPDVAPVVVSDRGAALWEAWCERGLSRFLTTGLAEGDEDTCEHRLNPDLQRAIRAWLRCQTKIDDLSSALRYIQAAILVDDLRSLHLVLLNSAERWLTTEEARHTDYAKSRLYFLIVYLRKALTVGVERFNFDDDSHFYFHDDSEEQRWIFREAHPAIFRALLAQDKASALLQEAVRQGSLEALKISIALGASFGTNRDNETPLHLVVKQARMAGVMASDHYLKCLTVLLRQFPEGVLVKNISKDTPLELARKPMTWTTAVVDSRIVEALARASAPLDTVPHRLREMGRPSLSYQDRQAALTLAAIAAIQRGDVDGLQLLIAPASWFTCAATEIDRRFAVFYQARMMRHKVLTAVKIFLERQKNLLESYQRFLNEEETVTLRSTEIAYQEDLDRVFKEISERIDTKFVVDDAAAAAQEALEREGSDSIRVEPSAPPMESEEKASALDARSAVSLTTRTFPSIFPIKPSTVALTRRYPDLSLEEAEQLLKDAAAGVCHDRERLLSVLVNAPSLTGIKKYRLLQVLLAAGMTLSDVDLSALSALTAGERDKDSRTEATTRATTAAGAPDPLPRSSVERAIRSVTPTALTAEKYRALKQSLSDLKTSYEVLNPEFKGFEITQWISLIKHRQNKTKSEDFLREEQKRLREDLDLAEALLSRYHSDYSRQMGEVLPETNSARKISNFSILAELQFMSVRLTALEAFREQKPAIRVGRDGFGKAIVTPGVPLCFEDLCAQLLKITEEIPRGTTDKVIRDHLKERGSWWTVVEGSDVWVQHRSTEAIEVEAKVAAFKAEVAIALTDRLVQSTTLSSPRLPTSKREERSRVAAMLKHLKAQLRALSTSADYREFSEPMDAELTALLDEVSSQKKQRARSAEAEAKRYAVLMSTPVLLPEVTVAVDSAAEISAAECLASEGSRELVKAMATVKCLESEKNQDLVKAISAFIQGLRLALQTYEREVQDRLRAGKKAASTVTMMRARCREACWYGVFTEQLACALMAKDLDAVGNYFNKINELYKKADRGFMHGSYLHRLIKAEVEKFILALKEAKGDLFLAQWVLDRKDSLWTGRTPFWSEDKSLRDAYLVTGKVVVDASMERLDRRYKRA